MDHATTAEESNSVENGSPLQLGPGPIRIPFTNQDAHYCPWEDQDNVGFLQGLLMTLKQSLFTPTRFFSRLPKKGGLTNPLFYALIIGTIGAMGGYLMGAIVENPFFSQSKLSGAMSILVGVFMPVFVLFGILIGTIFLHISLFLVGGLNENFESTFRTVCYSSGPDIFNVIPAVGWLVVLVWKLVVTVIGVREVQGIGTGRATVAVLLPAIVCCVLSFAGILAIISIGSGLV